MPKWSRRLSMLALLTLFGSALYAQQEEPSAEPVAEPPPGRSDAAAGRRAAEVDLDALLLRVAETTGQEFLVDPRVRARVFAAPPIQSPTYEDLQAILRIHGFMAVEDGHRVSVMPDAAARQRATRVLQSDEAGVPDGELITRVIALDIDDAGPLVPVLRPLLPQWAHLSAMDNKLVIVDRYDNVRRITALANVLSEDFDRRR
jgi:general secretion pathway protein D